MMRDIATRDNRAPVGPSFEGAVPSSQFVTSVRPGGGANTGGWQIERRFGEDGRHPTAHVAACDRLMDEQDRRDKAELKQKLARKA